MAFKVKLLGKLTSKSYFIFSPSTSSFNIFSYNVDFW